MNICLAFGVLVFYHYQARAPSAHAAPFFSEDFEDGLWYERWVFSEYEEDLQHGGHLGEATVTTGTWSQPLGDKALTTLDDESFYRIGSAFRTAYKPSEKPLVLHYSFKAEVPIECGGGFMKYLSPGVDLGTLNSESPAKMIFGPDFCGTSTRHLLLSFIVDGKEYKMQDPIRIVNSRHTHTYSLVFYPNGDFKIAQDLARSFFKSGSLKKNFPALLADHPDFSLPVLGAMALDVWQVRGGTMIDNILVTDDESDLVTWNNRKWNKDMMAQEEKLVAGVIKRQKQELKENQQRMEEIRQEHIREARRVKEELKARKLGSVDSLGVHNEL